MSEIVYYGIETPLGVMRVYAHDGKPVLVSLPGNAVAGAPAESLPPSAVSQLISAIESYFRGEEVPFRYARVLIDSLPSTPFERTVFTEVARIPRGETRAYGEIAELAGRPRAARAVGNVMHGNPFPVVIPCHRVIRAGGVIGGYGGAEHLKSWLLRFEGTDTST